MVLEKLKELGERDLQIDNTDLARASLQTPKLLNRWLKYRYKLRKKISQLSIQRKQAYRDRWLYYTGKDEEDIFPLKILKGDINIFLEADEKIIEIEEKMEEVKQSLAYVDDVITELNRRSFHIKNAIDWLKWTQGG